MIINKLDRPEFKNYLTYIKAECLFWIYEENINNGNGKVEEILNFYKQSLEKCPESNINLKQLCLAGIARCKFIILNDNNNFEETEEILKNLKNSPPKLLNVDLNFAWIYLKCKKYDQATSFAKKAIENERKNNFCRLIFGKILWQSGQKNGQTMKEFFESAKLNSQSWESFYYLALCQLEINNNTERALQCFERANALIEYKNETVALALSDLYKKLKMEDKNLKFLKNCTENLSTVDGFWVWFRFGVELLTNKRFEEAISTFQTLLR